MYYLYPKISLAYAEKLAVERSGLAINVLRELSTVNDPRCYFSATGGNRIPNDILNQIQLTVRSCAERHGYPNQVNDEVSRSFDIECGIICFEKMYLHPSEASNLELWSFMTCVLLPDIVRWRFPGETTSIERFIGSDRGLRRNTYGRLWWRSYLLRSPELNNPYIYIHSLFEDDLVQITERNSIAASPTLIRKFCKIYLEMLDGSPDIPRRSIIREATKRLRRLLSFINYDALDYKALSKAIEIVFLQTITSLEKQKAAQISSSSV